MTFNSLFEMPTHRKAGGGVAWRMCLSILYLRCTSFALLPSARGGVTFNSLFEMHYKTGGYGRGVVPIFFQFSI